MAADRMASAKQLWKTLSKKVHGLRDLAPRSAHIGMPHDPIASWNPDRWLKCCGSSSAKMTECIYGSEGTRGTDEGVVC